MDRVVFTFKGYNPSKTIEKESENTGTRKLTTWMLTNKVRKTIHHVWWSYVQPSSGVIMLNNDSLGSFLLFK